MRPPAVKSPDPAPAPAPETGPDDAQLVRQAQAGDLEAYDVLMRRHQERLYATVYHMTGNHEDAADITQDTFIKAYNALRGFKGDCLFFTWLYRIAVNRTLNFLKQRKNRAAIAPRQSGTKSAAGARRPLAFDTRFLYHSTPILHFTFDR